MFKRIIFSLQFLTILPVRKNIDTNSIKGFVNFFPLVGLLIGALLAAVFSGAMHIFPKYVSVVLVLTASAAVTGILHLDGFCDTIDGLFGGKSKEERLKIMSDEQIGSFAVVSVVLLLMLKASLLYSIENALLIKTLLVMPVIARWAVVIAGKNKPAKESGLGYFFSSYITKFDFVVSTLITGLIAYYFLGVFGIGVLLAAFIFVLAVNYFVNKKIGGITGDIFGFIIETTEILVLIILCIHKQILF